MFALASLAESQLPVRASRTCAWLTQDLPVAADSHFLSALGHAAGGSSVSEFPALDAEPVFSFVASACGPEHLLTLLPCAVICAVLLQQDVQSQRMIDRFVREARSGDAAATLNLLEQFSALIKRSARQAASHLPHEEHVILVSEVRYLFLVLLANFNLAEEVPFTAYVCCMLPQSVFNFVRKERRRFHTEVVHSRDSYSDNDSRDWQEGKGGEAINEHDEHLLETWWEEALCDLPQRQRQVMALAYQGLTEREIATCLAISGPRVNQLKQGAQKKLQKQWLTP